MTTEVDYKAGADRMNIVIGSAVTLAALLMYLKTVSLSISFWDCGEFVACSVIFGIPHPPGSSVFILIGKIFSAIPFSQDMAYRVNLLSVFSSAAGVFVAYFITTRLISCWKGEDGGIWNSLGRYAGGVVGALSMGFNRTFWTNAVEAEVYGLSTLFFLLVIYLLVVWYSRHDNRDGDKLITLVIYLSVLGSGTHMSAFLALPAGIIFIALTDRRLRRDPRYWILSLLILAIVAWLKVFLFGLAVWFVISLVGTKLFRDDREWKTSAVFAMAALLAFSLQFYVPIRSSFDPVIDMNNPDNFDRFVSFLQREQYGQENMITRMFHRRGELVNQFGDFPRMGFGGFFSEQYSKPGGAFVLMLAIGLFGTIASLRRNWRTGVLVLLLLLAGTVGLVLYMNFADGTQVNPATMAERLEVRDRDYFWTQGFAMFGICIGLGVAAFHRLIRNKLVSAGTGEQATGIISLATALVMLLLPVITVAHNYRACDRTLDTLPFDYAYNVLNTCEEGSILFSAGDNDTFPLWALQYGLGIRPDVRVVNLSLLDTDWYALQMKENLDVPISLTKDQILATERVEGGVYPPIPRERYFDPAREWRGRDYLRPFQDEKGQIIRVQHQLIENILVNNKWEYPIYFVNPPPSEVIYDLGQYSERVGMLFRITREAKNGAINVDESYRLFRDVYQIRNLGNPKHYKDETATSMALGLGQKYYDLYAELAATGDSVRAPEIFYDFAEKIPEFWQHVLTRAAVDSTYGIEGKTDQEYMENYLAFVEELLKYAPDNFFYVQYKGVILQSLGRIDEGLAALEKAYEMMPTSSMCYRSLLTAYISGNMTAKAVELSIRHLRYNPLDQTAQRVISSLSRP